MSSPTRLKSSILKFESPRFKVLVGSVRTIRQDRLILQSYSTCLSIAYLLGQLANFIVKMRLIWASITASDISTCARGSDNAMMAPTGCFYLSIQSLSLFCFDYSLALRRALTFYIISFNLYQFFLDYYYYFCLIYYFLLQRSASYSAYYLFLQASFQSFIFYCSFSYLTQIIALFDSIFTYYLGGSILGSTSIVGNTFQLFLTLSLLSIWTIQNLLAIFSSQLGFLLFEIFQQSFFLGIILELATIFR